MSTAPPPPGPPLSPNDPRGGDPTNPIAWVIIGGALVLVGGLLAITLLNKFSSKPIPPTAATSPSAAPSATATPGANYKLIFEGSADGAVKNPEGNRQDFKGARAHEAWHLEYYVIDGSTSAADTKTATVSGSAQYMTYSGSGTCNSTAAQFGDYPALKTSPTGGNSFSIRPPIGYSYVQEGTCPAFMTGFAAVPEAQFTITPGRPSVIQLPLKTYNYVLSAAGPNGQETATVSWSGTIRVMAQ